MVLAGGLMGLLMIGTFALLFLAITGLGKASATARESKVLLIASGRVEKIVVDLDEDARGLALTADPIFGREYEAGQADLSRAEEELRRGAARGDATQARWARQIEQANEAYLHDYVIPLMATERSDPAAARSTVESGQGLSRLIALRDQCAGLENAQRGAVAVAERRSVGAARTATLTAAVSAAATLMLICFFVAYLTRAIVRPVRRAAMMAGTLAAGDLDVRMPETSPGEIGRLESQFNAMVDSLQANRDKLRQVVEEQSALRRVATLVARGVSPAQVFDAVAAEVGHVLGVDHTEIIRYECDDTARVVGYWSDPEVPKVMPPLGGHWPVESGTVTATVRETERPARMRNYERATSAIGTWAHQAGLRCVVGCPVKVEGRIWGAMLIHSLREEPLPCTTEARTHEFMELVGAAIANAQSRSDLLASRARVVAAADESRRRIERDLHDGAQQRLVTLALKLRTVETTALAPGQDRLRKQLSGMVHDLSDILDDLQEVSRGIVPPILTRSGLPPALRSLVRRCPVAVQMTTNVAGRLPERIEVGLYYTVSEALTNVVKHARATEVRVDLTAECETVRLSVQDNGTGGADLSAGSGLVGLKDRVEALGGRIEVISPLGGGTAVLAELPLEPAEDQPAEGTPTA